MWGWMPGERVVACRDVFGQASRVVVSPAADGSGVLLSPAGGGPLRLSGRQARRLGRVLARTVGRADAGGASVDGG